MKPVSLLRSLATVVPLACALGAASADAPEADAPKASQEVSLEAHLAPGEHDTFVYTAELSQAPTGEFGDPYYIDFTLEFTTRVKKVNEKYTDIDMVFTHIVIDSTRGEFDSSTPEEEDANNLMAQAFRPAIGRNYSIRLLNEDMRVLGVTSRPYDSPDLLHSIHRRVLGDEALAEALRPVFRLKADPPTASTGDTWSQTDYRNLRMGHMEVQLNYKLGDVEDGVAHIDITGEHVLKLDQTTPVSQRLTDQKIEGSCAWDANDGILDDYELLKSFTVGAGDDQLNFGVEVVETMHISRKER